MVTNKISRYNRSERTGIVRSPKLCEGAPVKVPAGVSASLRIEAAADYPSIDHFCR